MARILRNYKKMKKKRAIAKYNLHNKSVKQLLAQAALVVKRMKDEPAFDDPKGLVNALEEEIVQLSTSETRKNAAKKEWQKLVVQTRKRQHILKEAYRKVVDLVNRQSQYNPVKIARSGLDYFFPGHAPRLPHPPAPGKPRARPLAGIGRIKVWWKGIGRRCLYVIYISTNPRDPDSWQWVGGTGKTKVILENLETGLVYWIRITVLGTKGEGPPSQPARSVAP